METNQLPDDLRRAVAFHGHLCPGLMIGWRAARAAAGKLGLGPAEDEELVAEVENDSCSVDAFQLLLSTTFGKGNLVFRDHGKQVFTLTDRKNNRAVRVAFVGDGLRKRLPDGSVDREAFTQVLLNEPDEKLLKVEEVEPAPPDKAVIEPSLTCARCGEGVQKSKSVNLAGRVLCRPCALAEGAS